MSGVFYTPVKTSQALQEVAAERAAQEARYGEANAARTESGTGPLVAWLGQELDSQENYWAVRLESLFRTDYEAFEALHGHVTWAHLVREEFAEVMMEDDPKKLRVELVQLAALCVAWMEKL